MPWVLLDVVLGVVAFLLLLVTGLVGWRHVRVLTSAVRAANESIAEASAGLDGLPPR